MFQFLVNPSWKKYCNMLRKSEMHLQSSKLMAISKTVLKLRICLISALQLVLNVHIDPKYEGLQYNADAAINWAHNNVQCWSTTAPKWLSIVKRSKVTYCTHNYYCLMNILSEFAESLLKTCKICYFQNSKKLK
jgi:hypothetical protein